jgi:hypothetical protein
VLTFASNNPEVAGISPTTGKIFAVAPGTAEIFATIDGRSGQRTITVRTAPAIKINEVKSNGGRARRLGRGFSNTSAVDVDMSAGRSLIRTCSTPCCCPPVRGIAAQAISSLTNRRSLLASAPSTACISSAASECRSTRIPWNVDTGDDARALSGRQRDFVETERDHEGHHEYLRDVSTAK